MAELDVACCTTEAQETCCEPHAKAGCCGGGDRCGCGAGVEPAAETERLRESVRERYAMAAHAASDSSRKLRTSSATTLTVACRASAISRRIFSGVPIGVVT